MKKFEFHLEKLLSYKGQMLDSELMTLAVLNSQLSEAQHRLLMIHNEQEQCRVEFESNMMVKTTPAACQMYTYYKEHLKTQIRETEKTIASINLQVDKQIDLIKKLKLEAKSLETLKTSRFDEYKKGDLKATEHQIEEFVSTLSIMKKAN